MCIRDRVKVVGSTSKPITPIGLLATADGRGNIAVEWGQTGDMINNGQKYNVYICLLYTSRCV